MILAPTNAKFLNLEPLIGLFSEVRNCLAKLEKHVYYCFNFINL